MSVRTCSLSAVAALLAFSLFLVHDTTDGAGSLVRQQQPRPKQLPGTGTCRPSLRSRESREEAEADPLTPRHDKARMVFEMALNLPIELNTLSVFSLYLEPII